MILNCTQESYPKHLLNIDKDIVLKSILIHFSSFFNSVLCLLFEPHLRKGMYLLTPDIICYIRYLYLSDGFFSLFEFDLPFLYIFFAFIWDVMKRVFH